MVVQLRQRVRDHIFQEITRSLCPECRRVIDAQVLVRKGAVYLRKHCPEHGWHEALVSSDAGWYLASLKYNKPGAIPFTFATEVERGCPFDCGLCPEHQQHTCLSLIEITSRCNLACTTCFADAGAGFDLSVDQVEKMLDRLIEAEGRPEVVQISGGEPTLHPQLMDILAAVRARNILHVMLNSNGVRLADDPEFVRRLARHGPTIYLQFDGLSARAHRELRGRDLRAVKQRALDNIAEAGLTAVLVATVVQGVNEGEIGDILRFGLEHPAVTGVSYQPATFAGRCLNGHDPLNRATVTGVLHALESQTQGLFRVSDFLPVPCPHPTCCASTYAYVEGKQVTPVTRLLNVDDYLDFITDRTVPDLSEEIRPALEALWSLAAVPGTEKATNNLTCVACNINIPLPANVEALRRSFFMVHVHGFMDEHTFDVKRLMKCCIHELLPDGRTVPFCAYNNLGIREQVKRQESASR
ncbi:MAG: radical SAM protein [Chloroflexi bacterium]|nr:radical SAM protein [Chloroflexota bacterium]